jgi:cell wall assembly regulator SMI1
VNTAKIFQRYVKWLKDNVPAAHANLAGPATDGDIAELEATIGQRLPQDLVAVLRIHNGQIVTILSNRVVEGTPCIPTLSFLSTRDIAGVWREWAELRGGMDASKLGELQSSCSVFPSAKGKVKPLYTSPGWIPLWADAGRPDYIGLDFDPDTRGSRGQVINFGRNEDRHFLCAPDYGQLMAILLEEVEGGDWQQTAMPFGKDRTIPWFGDPDVSFFETLYHHAEGK